MANKFRSTGQIRLATTVLCALFFCSVECDWTLQDFARDFCDTVAQSQGVQCDCVDITVLPGQDSNSLCGYSQALGPGLQLVSTTFTGWSTDPSPSSQILLQLICDANNSETNTLACKQTEKQSLTATTTTTISVGTGLKVGLKFPLGGGSEEYNFSFQGALSTSQGNNMTATSTCGPGGTGQPAGTCQIYEETCLSYSVPDGTSFDYDAIVTGGVQMSFNQPIDAAGAAGQGGDGSTHYYWYFPISEMVSYAQSVGLPNANQFDNNYPVTFYGSGFLTGLFLDVHSSCSTSPCS